SGIHVVDCACRTGVLTFVPFALAAKGASAATIGLAFALIFAGGAAGKLVCGLLGDRIGLIRTVVLTEFATAGLIIATLLAPLWGAIVLLPLLGIALNGTSSVLYGTVGEFVRADRQARAFGLFYTLGSIAGTLSPIAFGVVGDLAGLRVTLVSLAVVALLAVPLTLMLRSHVSKA
ncbi:MAG: MFS transporter, partial [Hyphomicrobiaceae bacterium]